MRLVSLIIVVMVAFAANSLLNRAALETGTISPSSFAAMRLISGVLCLALLGGALLLGEVISAAALGAAAVVLGGIALSVVPLAPRRKSTNRIN